MESVIKNALGIIIDNKDIEGADRIVYETGIYKAVVISARASECFYFFLNIEVERLSWLIVTLQSRKGKVLWFEYFTLNLTLGCLPAFNYDIKFSSSFLHFLWTLGSLYIMARFDTMALCKSNFIDD